MRAALVHTDRLTGGQVDRPTDEYTYRRMNRYVGANRRSSDLRECN